MPKPCYVCHMQLHNVSSIHPRLIEQEPKHFSVGWQSGLDHKYLQQKQAPQQVCPKEAITPTAHRGIKAMALEGIHDRGHGSSCHPGSEHQKQ